MVNYRSIIIIVLHVAIGDVCVFTLDGLKHFFVHGLVDPVVGVHKADKFALRNIHSKVARTGQAAVFLNHRDYQPRIAGGIVVNNALGIVRGTVIDDDYLIILHRLSHQ